MVAMVIASVTAALPIGAASLMITPPTLIVKMMGYEASLDIVSIKCA